MTARVIAFPRSARKLRAAMLPIGAASLAGEFADHFLPVVQASVDLLSADETDFEAQCRGMLDGDGTVMIDELCAEMRTVGRQMQVLVDGLDLTRARLRTAMARLAAPLDARLEETS